MMILQNAWQIELDPQNIGRSAGWFRRGPSAAARPTKVPGLIQQIYPGQHGVAWYWTRFATPATFDDDERCLLRFNAVDYLAEVWVNGESVGEHEGGETPFTLDVTHALRHDGGANLLAVRVLNPTDEAIDGIVLGQTPHRNKKTPYSIGWSFNRGGIVQPVEMLVVPSLRVTSVFARPDIETGAIRAHIVVSNDSSESVRCALISSASAAMGGDRIAVIRQEISAPPGASEWDAELIIPHPHLWDLENPYLYRVDVALEDHRDRVADELAGGHNYSARCGFRELRVVDGYFRLNGRRIFLRCTHTGNDWPSGIDMTRSAELLRRDMLYAKTAGFNTIRFIAGMATPQQLDFCDELGLMVYEEAYSSWCMEDSPYLAERFDQANEEMIRRDRNHPSVVIWGLLNETLNGPVFRHAVQTLPLVRSLDDTRLVFLNTGRMDCELGIGSICNPGSDTWEHMWGGEAPGASRYENLREPHTFGDYPGGYFERVGDAHMYPPTPHTAATIRFLRTLGQDTKPVFLGEYGIASTVDAIRVTRLFEQHGASQTDAASLEDAAFYQFWAERFAADWRRYGMETVTPFPEDILRQSQQLHGAQRLVGLNAIRANPKICGYNLTGTVDQGMTAEGLWTTWREFKPGVIDAVADGLAPLRWCMFVEPLHGYRGQSFELDVVLANEDALLPGNYPIVVRVSGPQGCVWERTVTLTIPATPAELPLAINLLSEEVSIDGPAGCYQLAASMLHGGAPAGGHAVFYIGDRSALPSIPPEITVWEDGNQLNAWLASCGVRARRFAEAHTDATHLDAEVIVVGAVSRAGNEAQEWHELVRRMENGATVIFVTPASFQRDGDPVGWLPLPAADRGRCDIFYNSIYHREDVAKAHPIFDGLPGPGILDWTYYRDVIPERLFQDQPVPDEVAAAAFALGYTCPGGYTSGIVTGSYRLGAGRFLINTLRLLENLGSHPVADRLLLNMINWAARPPLTGETL
jgi:hypothetical protein